MDIFLLPLSTELMYVRCRLVRSASSSWLSDCSVLKFLIVLPTAFVISIDTELSSFVLKKSTHFKSHTLLDFLTPSWYFPSNERYQRTKIRSLRKKIVRIGRKASHEYRWSTHGNERKS